MHSYNLFNFGLFLCIGATAQAQQALPAPAKKSHAATQTYHQPLTPEVNPWQSDGIKSTYAFAAYYTRKNVDEHWHTISRTDETADIKVKFNNSADELVFWRGASYLPYWKTNAGQWKLTEHIERHGDGPPERPDKVNRHSSARIIESSDERIVIHWRYLTDFPEKLTLHNPPDQTKFVDEYFIIRPDKVIVRGIRPGTPSIEQWRDPSRVQIHKIRLTDDGIQNQKAQQADRQEVLTLMGFDAAPLKVAEASPLHVLPNSPAPVLNWNFDEGQGRTTIETVTDTPTTVAGHGAMWRTGVSGHALMFDGYNTRIELPADKTPKVTNQITLDAWICIAAYPWNTTAIIQQGNVIDEDNGYALAIHSDGKPGIFAMIDGQKTSLLAAGDDHRIKRFRWTRITGVINTKVGEMKLYLDGQEVAQCTVPQGKVIDMAADLPVVLGQGPPLDADWLVGRAHGKSQFGFDGLIDEVRVYDQALSGTQVTAISKAATLLPKQLDQPDMERRVFPSGDKSWSQFGAHFTRLRYHEANDQMYRMSEHPDIVVTFDKHPTRYVMWHCMNYIPMMVNENGQWYSNEFNETWDNGGFEPMADKKMIFGQVHVVEQSPARIVLKWRYPLNNVDYTIMGEGIDDDSGWGEWSDWYLFIYPDGTCAKQMRSYMGHARGREWHESMVILSPEQHPEKVIETQPALIVATEGGEVRPYDWIDAPPEKVDYDDVILHVVNMKAEYDPFSIIRVDRGNVYTKRGDNPYGVFPAWNHWPISQFPSGGRYARYPDRAAHCSLTHLYWAHQFDYGDAGTFQQKYLLEGLSKQPVEEQLTLAKSYVNPAALTAKSAGFKATFDPNQKAYLLERADASVTTIRLQLEASAESPVVNPAFVVENWGANEPARIKINQKQPGSSIDLRQGVVRRPNGVNALVIWMEQTTTEPFEIEIQQS